jgi:ribonucleotide monophosphatase NagD (HAD superfamily)
MNLGVREVAMVDDRVDSDIAGARIAGMRSILIKTGEYGERDLEGTTLPDHVLNSIKELVGLFYA